MDRTSSVKVCLDFLCLGADPIALSKVRALLVCFRRHLFPAVLAASCGFRQGCVEDLVIVFVVFGLTGRGGPTESSSDTYSDLKSLNLLSTEKQILAPPLFSCVGELRVHGLRGAIREGASRP